MPFRDAAFDVAFCQLGLQYFPDRPKALEEMRRVLASGGRLVLMVWQSIDQSPGFALLADALERTVGASAGGIMRAPFVFADPDQVRALIAGAGFQGVSMQGAMGTVRFPSAEHFVQYQVAGSPLAGPVGESSDDAKTALLNEIKTAMAPYESSASGEVVVHLEELDLRRPRHPNFLGKGADLLLREALELCPRLPDVNHSDAIGRLGHPVEQSPGGAGPARTEAHLLNDLVVLVKRGPLEVELHAYCHLGLLVDRTDRAILAPSEHISQLHGRKLAASLFRRGAATRSRTGAQTAGDNITKPARGQWVPFQAHTWVLFTRKQQLFEPHSGAPPGAMEVPKSGSP